MSNLTTERDVLLSVDDLCVSFDTPAGRLRAASGVTFDVERGQIIGIVGESGAGKSVTMSTILGLLNGGHVERGSVRFGGMDLLDASDRELRALRGSRIGTIFQDPMTSLNPVRRIGMQLVEAIENHDDTIRREDARTRVIEALRRVGIHAPEERFSAYPHELSGGMRQRVMIAMAMLNSPELLIADEPTTALDVTIQAQVLRLIADLRDETQTAVLLITHDLGVVAEIADVVVVMYAGRVVEKGPVADVFDAPAHPYTRALMSSLPTLEERVTRLPVVPGAPPRLTDVPSGCAFHPRCWLTNGEPECSRQVPELRASGSSVAACHFSHRMPGHDVNATVGGVGTDE